MNNSLNNDEIAELADKMLKKTISIEEKRLLTEWYNSHEDNKLLINGTTSSEVQRMLENVVSSTMSRIGHRRIERQPLWSGPFLRIAAMLLICLSLGLIFYLVKPRGSDHQKDFTVKADAHPGSKKALLILADGRQIELSSRNKQRIRVEDGDTATSITGSIRYDLNNHRSGNKAGGYHLLKVPNGGEYQVILSDGTRVQLNAASSLKYPIQFNASERTVELNGEGYFEVKHDSSRPFRVVTKGQVVVDLGTRFNIRAYPNSKKGTVTTLEQGMIRVDAEGKSRIVHPGQQSIVNSNGIILQAANMKSALAWKNGNMIFENADLQTIISELARWYDFKYIIDNGVGIRKFSGGFSRSESLANVLDIFRESDIGFRMIEKDGVKTLLVASK